MQYDYTACDQPSPFHLLLPLYPSLVISSLSLTLLQVNVEERPSAEQVMEKAFFRSISKGDCQCLWLLTTFRSLEANRQPSIVHREVNLLRVLMYTYMNVQCTF